MSKLLKKLLDGEVVFNRKKFEKLTADEQMELAEKYYDDIKNRSTFIKLRTYIDEYNAFGLMVDYTLYPEFEHFVDDMQSDIMQLAVLQHVDIYLLSLHPIYGSPFYDFVQSFGTDINFASDWECYE